jgi:hypothetical protein
MKFKHRSHPSDGGRSMTRRIGLALSFVLWIVGALPAQGEQVAVSGRIVDGDGRPVAGATIELVPVDGTGDAPVMARPASRA